MPKGINNDLGLETVTITLAVNDAKAFRSVLIRLGLSLNDYEEYEGINETTFELERPDYEDIIPFLNRFHNYYIEEKKMIKIKKEIKVPIKGKKNLILESGDQIKLHEAYNGRGNYETKS